MSAIGDIFRVLNMPCREHHPLFSRQMDDALPVGVRIGLRLHAVICAPCRRLRDQLRALRAAARRLRPEAVDRAMASARMPEEVRERLTAAMK